MQNDVVKQDVFPSTLGFWFESFSKRIWLECENGLLFLKLCSSLFLLIIML